MFGWMNVWTMPTIRIWTPSTASSCAWLHPLSWVSLAYSESTSQQVRTQVVRNPDGSIAPTGSGIGKDYAATMTATLTSTAADATLWVADPSATATAQRSVTATITAIDPAVPSITLQGPDKKIYTEKVADKEALKQVKVGDRLDITWSAAILLSADTPKK